MNRIYACKLYIASSRKDAIRSALSDPINVELVQQLRSYLDDEYLDSKYLEDGEHVESPVEYEDQATDESTDKRETDEPTGHPSASRSGGHSNLGSIGSDLPEDLPDSDEPIVDDIADDESVSESVKLNKQYVASSMSCCVASIVGDLDTIQGTLNARSDTAGVVRIRIVENELWIHYNDSINLNNVMEPVIAVLNATNYNMLQFNRLARTENAIVFQIVISNSAMMSIQDIDNEK